MTRNLNVSRQQQLELELATKYHTSINDQLELDLKSIPLVVTSIGRAVYFPLGNNVPLAVDML
jgi:hypothetical protein